MFGDKFSFRRYTHISGNCKSLVPRLRLVPEAALSGLLRSVLRNLSHLTELRVPGKAAEKR